MGTAYTPGLTISRDVVVRKLRRLPLAGEVLVSVGEEVEADTPVGCGAGRSPRLASGPYMSHTIHVAYCGREGRIAMGVEDKIAVDPAICAGRPVIRGTRIPVRNILGVFAGGGSIKDVLEAYPELTEEQVRAAAEYAAQILDEGRVTAFKGRPVVGQYDPKEFPYPREPKWERKWDEAGE